jgi:plastocyanin
MRDDCDPTDPSWAPTGGCLLENGDVNRNEFNALLVSPLSKSTVGHPAWRAEPSYLKLDVGTTVAVQNTGGRTHTFTEVAQFGGGRVPPLNVGLVPAPECATATDLPAGATQEVNGLSAGNHRFQCCIHPWMRALVKVKPEDD